MSQMPADELFTFAERSYLDYARYVILDRALPRLGDGLKPVQRRLLFAMRELGLTPDMKPKKSARTIGDVLGKYHPHGDTACYEAMVLMAQSFTQRYPLIEGQGNFGAPDNPKAFAAMRYTEARLAPFALPLLDEHDMGTTDRVANFDGSLEEPVCLPAALPNLLLNGATGIAVGMATDIPPHNLVEVVAALTHLIDQPQADTAALMHFIHGPDAPTTAQMITPRGQLHDAYATGHGSYRLRAPYEVKKGEIVITDLPYRVAGENVMSQIADEMNAKRLPMVEDVRDQSDHQHPVRISLKLARNADPDGVMAHLFATTSLEQGYKINLNCLGLDGRPGVRPLTSLLSDWLDFRRDTVTRRLQFQLARAQARLHILEGLIKAFDALDQVIHIIRTADKPAQELKARLALSDEQVRAILEMRLRQLSKLEKEKLEREARQLAQDVERIEAILASRRRLDDLIKQELSALAEQHGDARRSPVVAPEFTAAAFSAEALASDEPITVCISRDGWMRAAKGHDIDPSKLAHRQGDGPLMHRPATEGGLSILFDTAGRCYRIPHMKLPSARGHGDHLTTLIKPPPGSKPLALLPHPPACDQVLVSSLGCGFRCPADQFDTNAKAGKVLLDVRDGAALAPVHLGPEFDRIALASSDGRLLIIDAAEVPELRRGKGVKLISLPGVDLVAVCAIKSAGSITLETSGGELRLTPAKWGEYEARRATRGKALPPKHRLVRGLKPS